MRFVVIIIFLLVNFEFVRNAKLNHSITIKVTGKNSVKGVVIINLYNTEAGFPTNTHKAIQSRKISATDSLPQTTFSVPAGIYAVAVMHDANSNAKMDKNFLGMPSEGYCVSNNVKGFMSAPSFTNAKFIVRKDTLLTLRLIY